jgi:hypothetical protein
MDIVVWLRGLGLGKYEAVFRDNDIDETVLRLGARRLGGSAPPFAGASYFGVASRPG